MRIVLFCENRYAVDILQPLADEAARKGHDVLWYIHTPKIRNYVPGSGVHWTDSMQQVHDYNPEAIFAPGNIIPYYLPGVKISIFHGYAAEKGDQFVIRRYFDAYFTQGPFFTRRFEELRRRYRDFEVLETGWTKQDWVYRHLHDFDGQKESLLAKYGKKKVVLYAPTFSPRFTSLPYMIPALEQLLEHQNDILLVMKFHPLTRREWCGQYRSWAASRTDVIYVEAEENVTRYQMMSDVMISDTSSVIYEFMLLGRPVITLRNAAPDILSENILDPMELCSAFDRALNDSGSRKRLEWVIGNYDPHMDGRCCERMLAGAEDYIRRRGVPRRRRLNLWRKYTSIKTFGRINRK